MSTAFFKDKIMITCTMISTKKIIIIEKIYDTDANFTIETQNDKIIDFIMKDGYKEYRPMFFKEKLSQNFLINNIKEYIELHRYNVEPSTIKELESLFLYYSYDSGHFLFDENAFLDKVGKLVSSDPDFPSLKKEFVAKFRKHLKNTNLKNWDKVTKRFFTVASKFDIDNLLKYSINLYLDYPGIRNHILKYISSLGFSKPTADKILTILKSVKRYDDVTLFNLCKMITRLEVPYNKKGKDFINQIDSILGEWESDFDLYCYLWFSAKYKSPHKLMGLIESTKRYWMNEQFLGRQAVSILPRVFLFKQDTVMKLIRDMMTSGPRDAASVSSNLHYLFSVERIKYQLYAYLRPPKGQKPYPLPKYLILTAVLSSPNLFKSERKKLKVTDLVSDPWYTNWLEAYDLI